MLKTTTRRRQFSPVELKEEKLLKEYKDHSGVMCSKRELGKHGIVDSLIDSWIDLLMKS
jgi:hypothetical protein